MKLTDKQLAEMREAALGRVGMASPNVLVDYKELLLLLNEAKTSRRRFAELESVLERSIESEVSGLPCARHYTFR